MASAGESLAFPDNKVRLMLIGKTGNGKSSTGNTILGSELFPPITGLQSGTEKCNWKSVKLKELTIEVTDTPGLCDTHRTPEDIQKEIVKCVATVTPGPHAVLMVFKGGDRFTQEDVQTYDDLKKIIGPELVKHMIVVFTGMDYLERDDIDLPTTLQSAPDKLQQVLREASGRYVGFNNKASWPKRAEQRDQLLKVVRQVLKNNCDNYYSNQLMNMFEKTMQEMEATFHQDREHIKEGVVSEKPSFLGRFYKSSGVFLSGSLVMSPASNVASYNVMLVGKTGSGKSSLGNLLLGKTGFDPQSGFNSGTQTSHWVKSLLDGVELKITDVPGLSDTHHSEETILKETAKSVTMVAPGPHVIIFVFSSRERYTQEQHAAYTTMKKFFTDRMCRFMILAFTGIDDIKDVEGSRMDKLIKKLKQAPPNLKEVLQDVKNRYIAIENEPKRDDKRKQRLDMIKMFRTLYSMNNRQHFAIPEKVNALVEEEVQAVQAKQACTREEAENIVKKEIGADKQPALVKKVEKQAKSEGWWCAIL